jgi:hypothetical protein
VATTTLLRIAGSFCAIVCIIGALSAVSDRGKARLTEIQLADDPAHVQALLADPVRAPAVRNAITIDYFFLAAYWAAFVTLALGVVKRGGGWIAVGVCAAITATATALGDVAENRRTTGLLDRRAISQSAVDQLRHVSLTKWALSALTLALLAGLFAQQRLVGLVAVTLVAVAAVGALGLFRHGLITPFFLALAALTLFMAVLLIGWPGTVAGGI